jgi:energy-coupling factor transport system ATP-binding protein
MRIEINDLHFTYDTGVEALRGVTFSVDPGERLAIVGQNGAGKTTLVKHLNALLKPTSGSVKIGDWDTASTPTYKLAQRVGYVFQNPDEQLFCSSVKEEVEFGPRNLGMDDDRVEALTNEAMALTEITEHADANSYDLSPSVRKLVAMAAVIAMDCQIVVLDEPTTGQDAVNIARMSHIVHTLHEKGKTVVTITHDMDFCAENFTRLIAMAQGQVILDAPMHEAVTKTALLESTYVTPPQLTRLGSRLNLDDTVCTPDEFMIALRKKA